MINGIQTLQQLDQGLGSVRNEIDRIDHELTRVSEDLHANRRQQAQTLKQMAEIRLDELIKGDLIGELNAADHRALELLKERQNALATLESEIQTIQNALANDEKQRQQTHHVVNQHAQQIIDAEREVQNVLDKDPAYQLQLNTARQLDSIANQAEEKAQQAERDRQEKGLSFESNHLFMYLWEQRYGTPDYQANTLIRALDGWVDKLCDYSDFRVTYWTLLEIPKRLLTHAESARTSAELEIEKLAQLERVKADETGLTERQSQHGQALAKLDEIDDVIEAQEKALNESLLRRTQFAEAKDTFMEQSLSTLHQALQNQSLINLSDTVHQTNSDADNQLVRSLADLHEQHDDLENELRDHRRLHEAKLNRLQQLEEVRRRFKNRRFDDIRSGFGNEDLISTMLGQFLNGLINSGELWRVLERHQRHRDVGAWPDFGSGGLGFPNTRRRRSPWHSPTSRGGVGSRSTGGFRLPRSGGSSSRGGFKTGGGF